MSAAEDVTAPERCWAVVGVSGDRSCPELPRVGHCRNCPVFARAAEALLERPAPAGYAEFWTENLAAAPAAPESTASVVLFRLGAEWLALDTPLLREVASLRPVHPIPHRAHTLLQGLVNIRGHLHLCVALDGLLQIPRHGAGRSGRLLVLESRAEAWVFPADEVFGVERFPAASLQPPPPTLPAALLAVTHGIFPWRSTQVGYLHGESVVATFARALT